MRRSCAAIGELADFYGGGTPSKSNSGFYKGDIPWISPKDMKSWNIFDSKDKITEQAVISSATRLLPPSSILIVNRSGILKHTLPVGITSREVAINQDLKALVCRKGVHPPYLARMISAAEPIVLGWVRATTADNFPIENLKQLQIPFPEIDEQKRIAAVLDQADALRRLRQRSLKRCQELGQSAFRRAFPAGAGRPVGLGNIAFVRSSLVDPKLPEFSHLPHVSPEHLPSGAGSVRWSAVKTAAEDGVISGKYEFDASCVLYSKIRPYLNKVALADRRGLCSADMYALEAIDGEATREFVFFALMQPEFLKFAESNSGRANIPKINRDGLLSYELNVPGIESQMDFTRKICAITNSKNKLDSYSASLEALFSSLQHHAFRGNL